MIHQVDKNLKEFGDKISAQEKGEAEAALAAAKSAMESNDPAALKQSTERLSQAAMKIGEAMYKAQAAEQAAGAASQAGSAGPGAGPGAGAPGGGAKPDEKVVDAEFEEVDEKKKRSA
jgi:molecular chaperone DnaK